jgi:ferric-dicitrate binding protein FerR (iron transport regulator)
MSSGSRRLTLDAGQQLVYDEQGVQATSVVAASDVSAWRTGALSFVGKPLAEVVAEINRYRPGKVLLRIPNWAGASCACASPSPRWMARWR